MLYKFKILLTDPSKNLWIQPTLGAIFAIIFSLLAVLGNYFIPIDYVLNITAETLSSLLNIIASSMLAVTTFSLSIMVSALTSTSNSATPRARPLIIENDYTRIAIASFISAFIYSVIAKIALGFEYYGVQGRFVLFISTILVLLYLIYTLIRWVQTISSLGSLSDALLKIEKKATEGMLQYRRQPDLGASHSLPQQLSEYKILSEKIGYLCHANLAHMQSLAEEYECHIHICERPGTFVESQQLLLMLYPQKPFNLDAEALKQLWNELRDCIVIDANRSYYQDPRFGLQTMSEVGQRAMSASINDPTTAIQAIHAITRIILIEPSIDEKVEVCEYPLLSIIKLDLQDLIKPIFSPISRDSTANLEISMWLIRSLKIISRHANEAALKQSAEDEAKKVFQRSLSGLSFEPDREALRASFEQ